MSGLSILLAAFSSTATSTATEELVVTGMPAVTGDPSASSSDLSAERLREARRRGEEIGELLDAVAGARALDFGGPVGERRLTIRGGAPAQLLTVVDGVVLGSSFATGVDLGILHPEAVGSMRVLRGGQGALYGDGALTGVLLVESRRPKDEPSASASMSGGLFGTITAGGYAAMAPLSLSASYQQTAGGFDYADRAFGLSDVERRRTNNDARRGSVALSAEQSLGDNRVTAAAFGSFRRAGVPGLISDEHPEARETQANAHARIGVEHPIPRGLLTLGISGAFLSLAYEDPPLEVMSKSAFVATTAGAGAEIELPGGQLARALAEVGGEIARSTEHGDPSRFRWSLALSDELALGSATLFAAARAVGVGGQSVALLPRAGLTCAPADGLVLRFGIGRSLRTPSIDELYRPSEAGFSGNPALSPETAWEAELGADWGIEHLRASAGVFARSISDVILYVNRNAFEVRPENLGDARALGGELELDGDLTLGLVRLRASGSLSLLFSELVETGERLPTQPLYSAAGQLDLGIGPVTVFTSVRGFGPTSTRVGSDREETRVPVFVRWDAGLEASPLDWLSVAFRTTNLLDDRGLQSVNKIPLPGRAYFVSLAVRTTGAS